MLIIIKTRVKTVIPFLLTQDYFLIYKLEKIWLWNLDSNYVKLVLEVFGPALKSLMFRSCEEVDMLLLGTCCVQLEHLSIWEWSSVKHEDFHPTGLNSDTFLPCLKSLSSHCCLGVCGSLIERKSTLIELDLKCCHIGTHVNTVPPHNFIFMYIQF